MLPGAPRAAAVLSGNELLDGRTHDLNGAFVADDLSRRGAKVTEVVTVADERERLTAALRHVLSSEPDVLVVGGGLGTTHDDLTAECLADVLDVPLVEHPEALSMLRERVRAVAERRGAEFVELLALARRQAMLPAGSEAIPPAGVAPGIAARCGPTRIYALPGVPFEFRGMWRTIAEGLEAAGFFPAVRLRILRIYGVGELQVAPLFAGLPRDLLEVGINVGGGEVTVRLRSASTAEAAAQEEAIVAALRAGAPVYSDDGRTVDDIVADGLRATGQTVAVAESCTGGLLGARLTERPGSSGYFLGGVISYADRVKTERLGVAPAVLAEHGAVSREVAAAMAEGVRGAVGADIGVSLTGVAGPDGGTAEKPVGLVYAGCATAEGTQVHKGSFPGDRDSVRRYSVTAALHLLRRALSL